MAILRNNNREKYTVLDNHAIKNNDLSLKALGLLVRMLSFPDNWHFCETGLDSVFKADGMTSIRSGLKELEAAGYLKRTKIRNEKKQMAGTEWRISETPIFIENPQFDFPISGVPKAEMSSLENHRQLNTNGLNTNGLNTDEQITKKGKAKATELSFDFLPSDVLKDVFLDFSEMRKSMKANLTQRALELAYKDLLKLSKDEKTQIEIVEQSIMRGWKGLFALPNNNGNRGDNANKTKSLWETPANELDYTSEKGFEL